MRWSKPQLDRTAILRAVFLCAVTAATADARRVTVAASKDNTLFGPFNTAFSNGAGPGLFSGATRSFGPRRALLQFALTDSLPANVRIDSVRLRLHLNRASSGVFTHTLHRLLGDWGEAGSISLGGGGALAQPSDATWSHAFYDSVAWSAAGGDFAAAPSAAAAVDSLPGDYFWGSTPGLVADVQAWADQPGTNFGWILIGDESGTSAKRFDSREGAVPSLRPELIIDFSPASPVEIKSWSWAKQRLSRRAVAPSPKPMPAPGSAPAPASAPAQKKVKR